MTSPTNQLWLKTALLGQFGAAREQDGKDNQDGDSADVDENLRKAGELRVKFEEQQRQTRKSHSQRKHAVDKALEQYGRQAAGQRECRDDVEDDIHRTVPSRATCTSTPAFPGSLGPLFPCFYSA